MCATEEEAAGRRKPAQLVMADCEAGSREAPYRGKQRMRDERSSSARDLLNCDGVYLPALHQQYPPSVCVRVCVDAECCVVCRTCGPLVPCCICSKKSANQQTFLNFDRPSCRSEGGFQFCVTLA